MISGLLITSNYNTLLNSKKEKGSTAPSSAFTTQDAWAAINDILCSLIHQRKRWQRVEFITCWTFVILLLSTSAALPPARAVVAKTGALPSSTSSLVSLLILDTATTYIQVSIITRVFAYAVDFANACKKLGSLPSWLILHHTGCVVVHSLTAFVFSKSSTSLAILCMLALQSTHNTWTKKYSMILYWGNVLLGVITTLIYTTLNFLAEDVELSLSMYLCMGAAFLITAVGVVLLYAECKNDKKRQ